MDKEQIDACVILELVMEQSKGKEQRRVMEKCRGYLFSHVATHCNALMSLPALGEIWGALLSKVLDFHERQKRFNRICDLIARCSIKMSSPTKRTYKIAHDIMEFDTRMEPADALRIAEAVTEEAIFITLERTLVENIPLQKKFNVKIKSPY